MMLEMERTEMMPTADSRSRYLLLALASRNLIKSLLTYVEQGQADAQLQPALDDVADSLRASKDANSLFGPVPTESPFRNYEQLLILKEAVEALDDNSIGEKLPHVLTDSPERDKRRTDVAEAVEFFYALENRALYHYNRQIGARDV
jgi:hypothetical protein